MARRLFIANLFAWDETDIVIDALAAADELPRPSAEQDETMSSISSSLSKHAIEDSISCRL